MQIESSKRPNKFEINEIENGKCTVLFFDNVQEVEASQLDSEEKSIKYTYDMYKISTNFRESLSEQIENNYDKWLETAKKEEYNQLAAEVRSKRNELLAETDKEMCIDRLGLKLPSDLSMTNIISSLKQFFEGFSDICNGKIAKYRQELRDITKQEGFPYNVVWPTKDKKEE